METLALRGLTFTYPGQTVPALHNVTLTVERGNFFVLCGPSGCGKSTLLRQCKSVLAPHGRRSGELLLDGAPLDSYDQRQQTGRIGFVRQSPDSQLVTDKVWHELAFGLESLGRDTPFIRRRVAEMASFFGIQNWFHRDVASLSGGQKQLLNLAAVMTLDPELLILDEPTSQLDPIAASDFLGVLAKLNRELGVTVLLTEHRLEDALPLANRAAVMDRGTILAAGTPRELALALQEKNHPMFLAMPTPLRVWAAVEDSGETSPITVREGRDWLSQYAAEHPLRPLPNEPGHTDPTGDAIACRELWFRYEKDGPDVVGGLSLAVRQGELLALLGGNGTGKTTLLKLVAGLEQPDRGTVRVSGTLGVLPQAPQALFVKKTVREDLLEFCPDEAKAAQVAALCRLDDLLDRHPFDLSGGEQQRAALAKLLLLDPEVLLLDEPTKGLDAGFKQVLAQILRSLSDQGVTILMVSHDIEFCAAHAHRCALMFDGAIVTEGTPRAFFSGNAFYTTAADRMGRHAAPGAITPEDLIHVCGGTLPAPVSPPPMPPSPPSSQDVSGPPAPTAATATLPLWRKLLGGFFAGAALLFLLHLLKVLDLSPLLAALGLTNRAKRQFYLSGGFSLSLLACALCFSKPSAALPPTVLPSRPLSRQTVFAAWALVLLIPLTLVTGTLLLPAKNYYVTILLVLLETIALFFLRFEGRKPRARELVLLAVLCALGVASRAALIMLPQFKPTLALTIIAGASLGGESGFLVGAVTMLASNLLFGQGPYTPWQMFAAGLVGLLAGALTRWGLLRKRRLPLCVFGSLATLVLYGGVMNLQSALQSAPTALTPGIWLSYELAGLPMDCIHAAATWFFLWVAAEPMLEKLERVKTKYGLTEAL